VGAGLLIEREQLLPLVQEGFDLAQTSFPTVNGLGCAKVLTNTYSVPLPGVCAPAIARLMAHSATTHSTTTGLMSFRNSALLYCDTG